MSPVGCSQGPLVDAKSHTGLGVRFCRTRLSFTARCRPSSGIHSNLQPMRQTVQLL